MRIVIFLSFIRIRLKNKLLSFTLPLTEVHKPNASSSNCKEVFFVLTMYLLRASSTLERGKILCPWWSFTTAKRKKKTFRLTEKPDTRIYLCRTFHQYLSFGEIIKIFVIVHVEINIYLEGQIRCFVWATDLHVKSFKNDKRQILGWPRGRGKMKNRPTFSSRLLDEICWDFRWSS